MKLKIIPVAGWLCFSLASWASPQSWSAAYLDQVLSAAQPGQKTARVGDMEILIANLRAWRDELAGNPSQLSAFDGAAPTWTGGNVYYTFDTNAATAVPAYAQKIFQDCAQEWATFANLHFHPRTTQANYVLVSQEGGLEGGFSTVGMIGGQQTLHIGPTSWNHPTVCHEMGHTLGLVHEHQRWDRDNFVVVLSNNVQSGEIGNFVLLPNSRNQGAYDFLSVMHYNRNSFSIDPSTLDTIEPLPAYIQYLNVMGEQYDPVLSALDRAGMAAIYGAAAIAITGVVTNTQDSVPGSLRAALYYAFDHPGANITFNIPSSDPGFSNGVFTIQPTDKLPSLVNSNTLDGATEPVHANAKGPQIVLNGALAQPPSTYANGLRLGGTHCVVKSIVVNGFSDFGIAIDGSNAIGNVVAGCYLGIDASGSLAVTNLINPVIIENGASSNTVGGVAAADRNVISGSYYQGLVIRDAGTRGNRVLGNYIGLNAAGTAPLPNRWPGVNIFSNASGNTIGAPGAPNVISGNGSQGILIQDASDANQIEGNLIGTDPSGESAVSNTWAGIEIYNGAQGNIVGPGNVISGNGNQGVIIDTESASNVVVGNFVGIDAAGESAIPNVGAGVEISGNADVNSVGPGNVISGNEYQGVLIDRESASNIVVGNYVGVDAAGAKAVPNRYAGVECYLNACNNVIGGVGEAARNVISGNLSQGIAMDTGSYSNWALGNYIGLDAAGLNPIPNSFAGIEFFYGADANTIGGGPGARNFISGNNNSGIAIDSTSSYEVIQGNSIGVNVTNGPVPNLYDGVYMASGAVGNLVGGTDVGNANLIADNGDPGVYLTGADVTNNTIRGNAIFGNLGGGISMDTGANLNLSPPSLSSATTTTNLSVSGSFTGGPNTVYHLDFYVADRSSFSPQPKVWLGPRDVTTSASGSVNFTETFGAAVPQMGIGPVVTATATDPAGNTSFPSAGAMVTMTDTVGDGIPNAWRAAHFGSGTTTNSSSCASCDPDHDGMSNYQEFLAGTDPNNAASALRLASPTNTPAGAIISFQSASGPTYRVDSRDTFTTNGWTMLIDQIPGTGGAIQVTDPAAIGLPMRFYRVEAFP